MTPKSIFIAQPSIAFNELLNACDQALSHKVTSGVDNTPKKLSDTERFLSILAAIRDADAAVGLPPNLLTHVSFSVLTVATEQDMMDILEACSGMAFTFTETKARGALMSVITGTVQQWRDAVVTGTNHRHPEIRLGFNEIHQLFVEAGLTAVWSNFEYHPNGDGSYLLIEYKQR